ncbi:MAG TPA: galactokinase family protein [Acidimicrobiales bacterium]|nr:galactokinase family protein [Acidimicrobiales bacterium]
MTRVLARAPGRVNLIGDHTDYTGGWVLPMAIELATTVEFRPGGAAVTLESDHQPEAATVALDIDLAAAATCRPRWARFVAGVVAVLRPDTGGTGSVTTTLPVGAGLSSSSALTVAVALALGFRGPPLELARLCQRAEQAGSGVPGGIMDQLCSAAAEPGAALLIDCRSLVTAAVPIPEGCEVIVAHSGEARELSRSAYAQRRQECEQVEAVVGPLRDAKPADLGRIADPVLQRRARHVVGENQRVVEAATLMRRGDGAGAGALMTASHRSLAEDFEVSTPALDQLVEVLLAAPGVWGARLTGAGFGGCVVALAEAGAWAAGALPGRVVAPSGGATVETLEA